MNEAIAANGEGNMSRYHVTYERDGARWFARVAELEGCQTQGRSLGEARERIREAIGLFDEHTDAETLSSPRRTPIVRRLKNATGEDRMESFPYLIQIDWSEEDGCFIARAATLGVVARGGTEEDALREVFVAGEGVIAGMKKKGRRVPAPDGEGAV